MLDVPKFESLCACVEDILCSRIPQFRAQHGTGADVEENVARMLLAAVDCMARAHDMLVADGEHPDKVVHLRAGIQRVLSMVEDCQAEAAGWVVAYAVVESARSTKH